jgi:8-oxo-dGTP diphosphatase
MSETSSEASSLHGSKDDYPRPSVTADILAFGLDGDALSLLLIRRGRDPHAGSWALPGGFCEPGETVGESAGRELEEETKLTGLAFEELHTFSTPGRDPRGWVIAVAHLAFVPEARLAEARGGDDADDAAFARVTRGGAGHTLACRGASTGPLAFDHDQIVALALSRLAEAPLRFAPALLGERFSRDRFESAVAALSAHGPVGGRTQAGQGAVARALDEGRVIELDGALAPGPRAFPHR